MLEVHKDAIGDHNDIRDGILEAAKHEPGSERWWAGVQAAREVNDEHMGEEEHEGLADFRRRVDLDDRHRIAVSFDEHNFHLPSTRSTVVLASPPARFGRFVGSAA